MLVSSRGYYMTCTNNNVRMVNISIAYNCHVWLHSMPRRSHSRYIWNSLVLNSTHLSWSLIGRICCVSFSVSCEGLTCYFYNFDIYLFLMTFCKYNKFKNKTRLKKTLATEGVNLERFADYNGIKLTCSIENITKYNGQTKAIQFLYIEFTL